MYPFFTIGHSTRPIDEFVELLRSAGITLVADVRTAPRSRTNVQYNHDVLPQSLATFQIGYEHIGALGGLRGRQQDVSPNINAFWQNESFHNYADYAMGEIMPALFGCARSVERNAAPSCVQKQYGGDAIDGLSPTICWR